MPPLSTANSHDRETDTEPGTQRRMVTVKGHRDSEGMIVTAKDRGPPGISDDAQCDEEWWGMS